MANDRQTTNYLDLILPKGPEYYSVQDGNTNFTILDTKIEEIVNSITSLNININSTIKKVVADLIGGATEGIDSLKDILDLLNDPESGELVKINEAINQRLTIESFDQFKTEHTKVHDTIDGRLTAIDDATTGSVVREQTARIAADEALNEKIGSLELLKTSNKEDVINAINEIVGNIGTLTSLKTSVKTSIVNAINSNKESIDALTTDTSGYNNKNGFYFYNLKNVLISDKSDDCYSYSNVSGNTYAFNIALKNIKLFYYGKIIDINQTYRMQTPTTGTYVIYVGMQINETDYMSNNDTGYTILETSGEDLAISPSNWVIGCERSATNNENIPITLPDDGLIHNGVVFKQPLIRISVTNSTSGSTINSISWVNDNNLPTLDYTNYYDYVNGIYRLVEENLDDTINSKIDELNEIVGKSNSFGGFTGGSSASATTGGAIGSGASATNGGAVGSSASATYGGGAVGFGASATYGGGAVGYSASSNTGGAVGSDASAFSGGAVGSGAKTSTGFAGGYSASATSGGAVGSDAEETDGGFAGGSNASANQGGAVGHSAKTSHGFAGGYNAQTVDDENNGIDAIQLGTGTNSTAKTLQVYEYQLMGANGNIPSDRLKNSSGGFAAGNGASATYGGGAVGNGASATYGGAVGYNASTTNGGAVGNYASATEGGGAVGYNASTTNGGAVGYSASATSGGAVGLNASTTNGGAVGNYASATEGGAVGNYARTDTGFAGGYNAKTVDDENNGIDAIQLGTGTNSTAKTLQVYDYQLMTADGNIPSGRLKTSNGGFAGGSSASATSGGAVGNNAKETNGGFAGGTGASAAYGGAVGYNASTDTGGAVGYSASATTGGAVGRDASANTGGAVGYSASATSGGAVGSGASTTTGGAVGSGASATSGGAVGYNAKTGTGFAGGYNAKTQDSSGDGIDAIQLGSGKNSTAKTLQVYNYQLMDAYGNIPLDRIQSALDESGISYSASSNTGGSVGWNASVTSGAAVGSKASANKGGAVGHSAKTSHGFAGGYNAQTVDDENNGIDAIQLGTGTNSVAKTLQVYEYQLMDANGNIPKERLMDNLNSYYTITGTTTFGYHMIAKVKDITKPMYAEVICGFYPKNDHTCIGKISIYYSPINEKKGSCKCIENYVSHETDYTTGTTQSASIGLLNVNNEVYIYMHTGSVLFNYNYYYYNISGVNIEIFDTASFMTTSSLESSSAIRLSSVSVNSSSPIIGRFVADTPTPI